jgi:transcriptional regulator with XRE-family HTH domain
LSVFIFVQGKEPAEDGSGFGIGQVDMAQIPGSRAHVKPLEMVIAGGDLKTDTAAKLQIAGLDISRSGVSKVEARLRYVDDKSIMFLAEVLKVPVQELFPRREGGVRISEFMEKLETSRF